MELERLMFKARKLKIKKIVENKRTRPRELMKKNEKGGEGGKREYNDWKQDRLSCNV